MERNRTGVAEQNIEHWKVQLFEQLYFSTWTILKSYLSFLVIAWYQTAGPHLLWGVWNSQFFLKMDFTKSGSVLWFTSFPAFWIHFVMLTALSCSSLDPVITLVLLILLHVQLHEVTLLRTISFLFVYEACLVPLKLHWNNQSPIILKHSVPDRQQPLFWTLQETSWLNTVRGHWQCDQCFFFFFCLGQLLVMLRSGSGILYFYSDSNSSSGHEHVLAFTTNCYQVVGCMKWFCRLWVCDSRSKLNKYQLQ